MSGEKRPSHHTSSSTAWWVGGPYTEYLMPDESAARAYQEEHGGILRSVTTLAVVTDWIDPYAEQRGTFTPVTPAPKPNLGTGSNESSTAGDAA